MMCAGNRKRSRHLLGAWEPALRATCRCCLQNTHEHRCAQQSVALNSRRFADLLELVIKSEWGGSKWIHGAQLKNGCAEPKGEAGDDAGAPGRRLVIVDTGCHVRGLGLDSKYDGLPSI